MKRERESMAAQPCECVSCADCGGSGIVWFSFDGEYLGRRHCDDLDRMEPCDTCYGRGTVETCTRCIELEIMDEENL